jgi:hypothetical protein
MVQRILLGQLGANGDCLYTTILARQLRADYATAEIVWAISTQCKDIPSNNPYVDRVMEIPVPDWSYHELAWKVFEREALNGRRRHEFDAVYLSQIWPNNFQNYDGTIRPSILRAYGKPLTVPIENVIQLTDAELERVDQFAKIHRLGESEHCLIFECSSKSGQSFVNPKNALDIADKIYELLPSARIVFSTNLDIVVDDSRSVSASALSLREISALTHHATLFLGAGSGCTVAVTSTAARPLPIVLLLKKTTSVFASFAHDAEYFGQDRHILELTNEDPSYIAKSVSDVYRMGFAEAAKLHAGGVALKFDHYLSLISKCLVAEHRYLDAATSLMTCAERYGWAPELLEFGRRTILPSLSLDTGSSFPANRRLADYFIDQLASAGSGHVFDTQRRYPQGFIPEIR